MILCISIVKDWCYVKCIDNVLPQVSLYNFLFIIINYNYYNQSNNSVLHIEYIVTHSDTCIL